MWVACVVLVLWSITPLRHNLQRHLLIDAETIIGVVGVVLIVVFRALLDIKKEQSAVAAGGEPAVLAAGVTEVYGVLARAAQDISASPFLGKKRRKLDVLGIDLATAWPHIEGFVDKTSTVGWQISLFCLSPDFVRTSDVVDQSWATRAETNVQHIQRYISKHSATLRDKRVALRLFTYRCFPAVHGFRIAQDTVVMSFVQWDKDGRLRGPYGFYEFFSRRDTSERANHYRALFNNWLDNAIANAVEVSAPGTSE